MYMILFLFPIHVSWNTFIILAIFCWCRREFSVLQKTIDKFLIYCHFPKHYSAKVRRCQFFIINYTTSHLSALSLVFVPSVTPLSCNMFTVVNSSLYLCTVWRFRPASISCLVLNGLYALNSTFFIFEHVVESLWQILLCLNTNIDLFIKLLL